MPKLPRNGWLQECVECGKVTSRLVRVLKLDWTNETNMCIKCRWPGIRALLMDFDHVVILEETVALLSLKVF